VFDMFLVGVVGELRSRGVFCVPDVFWCIKVCGNFVSIRSF
jgi:hypothetical protein